MDEVKPKGHARRAVEKTKQFFIKNRLKILFVIVGLLIVEVAAQVIWPTDKLLPFSKVGAINATLLDRDELQKQVVGRVEGSQVLLQIDGKTAAKVTPKALGVNGLESGEVEKIYDYPLAWRFVPFSFLAFRANVDELKLTFNTKKLDETTDEKLADLIKGAVDAEFVVNAGKVTIKPEKFGYTVTKKDLLKQLKDQLYNLVGDTALATKHEKTTPDISAKDYEQARAQAEAAIKKDIHFALPMGDKTEDIATTANERASLLLVRKADDGKMELALKDDALVTLFDPMEQKIKKAPGISVVTLLNGVATGQVNGLNGQGLNYESYKRQLEASLLGQGGAEITLEIKPIPPVVRYEREFTHNHEGLQAYLDSVTNGQEISVSVQQLSGDYWGASAGGDKRVTSASTYKLFMAQFILNKIDIGQLSWDSVANCMTSMIVKSANDCSENWLVQYTRATVDGYLTSTGYQKVFTAGSGAASTTANDLKKLLTHLHYGENFSAANQQRLLSLMRQQVYRQGIPAGSAGAVADKVGFLDRYLNDAGIVYHPQGTYVLVIMTNNQSWAKIAEITREVERIMYE